MPRIKLTDRSIAGLKPSTVQRDYFDLALPGFGVRVSPHGTKSFVLIYRNADQRLKRLTLGTYEIDRLVLARCHRRHAP
jgi:hypothetical protein